MNNYFTEVCSDSEAGSYLRRIDFVYHSAMDLKVIRGFGETVSAAAVDPARKALEKTSAAQVPLPTLCARKLLTFVS